MQTRRLLQSPNRTCRSPASGSPTGFTARHTTGQLGAGVRDAADRVWVAPREAADARSISPRQNSRELIHRFVGLSISTAKGGRQVLVRWPREVLGPRCDLWSISA